MILAKILNYNNIVIQCHDNPDADTIASGYALYTFLHTKRKNVRLIYSGASKITKPNLCEMIRALKIPLEYTRNLDSFLDLLITVDCQHGEGNVTYFKSPNVAMIDHHINRNEQSNFTCIRSTLGSCSTLVWHLLKEYNFDFNINFHVATALYYGLLTDTNNFAEVNHPLDKDLMETLAFDRSLIRQLKNSNLSFKDLETAGVALLRCSHNLDHEFAIFKANPCDSNILGFISDLAIQVDTIDSCIVYNYTSDGIKFSVRSSTKEIKANELAEYVSINIGSGGGHIDKAGGFICLSSYEDLHPNTPFESYLLNLVKEYYDSFDIIYSDKFELDKNFFTKTPDIMREVGVVKSTDLYSEGTPIIIRTYDKDTEIITSKKIYLIISEKGDVHPINEDNLNSNYQFKAEKLNYDFEYSPKAKNKYTGESISLLELSRCIRPINNRYIYIQELKRNIKLFSLWDREKYLTGYIGDYLAFYDDNPNDLFIIKKELFPALVK